MLNSAPCLSKDQILAQIPSRKVVDRLVSQFFNAFDMGPCKLLICESSLLITIVPILMWLWGSTVVIHRKTFLAEVGTRPVVLHFKILTCISMQNFGIIRLPLQ